MTQLAALAVLLATVPPGDGGDASFSIYMDRHRAAQGPLVQLSMNQDELFEQGDRARVYFRAERASYVTIFRVDTDGRVRVIHPLEPWEDNYARARQRYEVRRPGEKFAFTVDDYPGQGYLLAVTSLDPFDYSDYVRGDHWDYRVIATSGRIAGDPYVALMELADHIVPANYVDYSYDVLPYFVEERYEYPRFLCYDCHAYAAYPYWDPYVHSCLRFRIVIYDEPYYYPARYYPGTRVVYRPGDRVEPRYVFKDRVPTQPYVVRQRARPTDPTGRRIADPGVTSTDLGGAGRVPAPTRGRDDLGPRAAPGRDGRRPAPALDGGRRPAPASAEIRVPSPSTPAARQPEERARPEAEEPEERTRQQPSLERRDPKRVSPPEREPRDAEASPPPSRPEPKRVEPRTEPSRAEPPRRTEPQSEPRRAEPARPPARSRPPAARPKPEPRSAPPPTEPRHRPSS